VRSRPTYTGKVSGKGGDLWFMGVVFCFYTARHVASPAGGGMGMSDEIRVLNDQCGVLTLGLIPLSDLAFVRKSSFNLDSGMLRMGFISSVDLD